MTEQQDTRALIAEDEAVPRRGPPEATVKESVTAKMGLGPLGSVERTVTHHYLPALDRLSRAKSGDVQEIAAAQIELLTGFYDLALAQAKRSFKWALIAAATGFGFFLGAIAFLLLGEDQSVAIASVVSGALVEVVSGINFYLYSKSTSQLSVFHLRLDLTQRFLLANSLCEGLEGEQKQAARSDLIAKLTTVGTVASDVGAPQGKSQ